MPTNIDNLSVLISADSSGLAADLRKPIIDFNNFKKEIEKSAADISGAKAAAKSANEHKKAAKEAGVAWRAVTGAGRVAGGAGRAAMGAGKVLAGGVVAGALFAGAQAGMTSLTDVFEHAKQSVNLAAEIEQTTLAFEVMLKSAERAKEMLGEIRKFGAETPFNNKELVDSSRKLIAYGIAADQVVPTIRMLGDVSAATQAPISELSYLYGTLAAQGRAYTRDIQQFAGRGIPIYEELAKVLGKSTAEVKDLVEEGKVGFPEVVKAFKGMTEGKGIYAGLTGRQGDTFAGAREQLFDALEMGKTKFGAMLIEELDLKGAAKDLTAFVEKMDGNKIRPFVREIGQAARGIAQLTSELVSAGFTAGAFFDKLAKIAFPELRALSPIFKLQELKDFKIDSQAVHDVIYGATRGMVSFFVEMLRGIRDIGQALDQFVVLPLNRGASDMMRTFVGAKSLVGQASPQEKFYPPQSFDTSDTILERYRAMDSALASARERSKKYELIGPLAAIGPDNTENRIIKSQWERAGEDLHQMQLAYRAFMSAFGTEEHYPGFNHALKVESKVPPHKNAIPALGSENGALNRWIKEGERRIAGLDERYAVEKSLNAISVAGEAFTKGMLDQVKQTETAFAGLAGGAAFAALQLKSIKTPEVPWAIPPDVQEAGKRAKDQFKDPTKSFVDEWNSLSQALLEGLITPDVHDLASADLIRRTSQQIGMGPARLPEAAEMGSQEAVRVINQWQAGQNGSRPEDFLKMLVETARQQLEVAKDTNRKTNLPLLINLPK